MLKISYKSLVYPLAGLLPHRNLPRLLNLDGKTAQAMGPAPASSVRPSVTPAVSECSMDSKTAQAMGPDPHLPVLYDPQLLLPSLSIR